MVEETKIQKEDTKDEKVDEEKEDVEKSNAAVLETVGELAKLVKASVENINKVASDVAELKEKSLETPVELPATPAGSEAGDDVGDEIKVPEKPYPQETSEQAGIDDASPESPGKTDGSGLEMQQKSVARENQFTTSTPRPGINSISKSDVVETPASRVLNAIRKSDSTEFQNPADRLSEVALMIKSGEFGRQELI